MELVYKLENINGAAEQLLQLAPECRVFAFEGELGSGKTTLIHAICIKLCMQGTFGSPTFSIINEYDSPAGPIYHIDLYRCRNEDEALRAGVEDCLFSGQQCFVEWPSRAPGIFPENTIWLTISVEDDQTRSVVSIECPPVANRIAT